MTPALPLVGQMGQWKEPGFVPKMAQMEVPCVQIAMLSKLFRAILIFIHAQVCSKSYGMYELMSIKVAPHQRLMSR